MALTKVTGQVIKNTTDVTVGVLTVTNTLSVGGTVSIGGTLTYEDVTNVDAVGLITARDGIVVGSGITLSVDGDIFATGISTFADGVRIVGGSNSSNLKVITSNNDVGIVSSTNSAANFLIFDNDTENKIRTVDGRLHISADVRDAVADSEIRFLVDSDIKAQVSAGSSFILANDTDTFLGHPAANTLAVTTQGSERLRISSAGIGVTGNITVATTANNQGVSIQSTGSNYTSLTGNAARTGADEFLLNIRGLWNDTTVANILFETGSDTTNKDDGVITFRTASAGTPEERVRIASDGDLVISGNNAAKNIEYGDGTTTGYFVSNTNVNRANADAAIHLQQFRWNNTKVAEIKVITGDDTTNKDNAHITFETASAGTTSERMRINSSGHVTKPHQPCFEACGASGNPSGATYITFTTVNVNIGSHYSNSTGKFIAPVAGTYFFSFGCIKSGNSSLARLYLYKNGSTANGRQLRMPTGGDGYGENGALTNIITLAANDEIQVYMSEGTIHGGTGYLYFNGYLIG